MKTFKIVVNEKEIEVLVKTPNANDIKEADRIYAQFFAELVKSDRGYLLKSELDKYLEEKKIWTDEDNKIIESIQDSIKSNLDKLKNKSGKYKLSECRTFALQITELRAKQVEHMLKRQSYDDVTVEAQCIEERFDYLIYLCTINNTDSKQFWSSFDEMKLARLDQIYKKAKEALISAIYGLNEEVEKNLPENMWLKKHKMVDDKLNLIHPKTGKPVDRSGRYVEDIKKEIEEKTKQEFGEVIEENPYIDDYEETVLDNVEETKTE